ncbi:MAG TPA: C40 family peptidase [Nocardioidaceae bacterium]|nr:C40 family peptidase [Nocardioidaceae bacterium]
MSVHHLHGSPDVLEVRVPVATMWSTAAAPRELDRLALLDDPDVPGWAASMDATVRKALGGRTVTQLLLGEGVHVLEDRGDWVRVAALAQPSSQHPDGYPGWVRRTHLGTPVPRTDGATAFVMTQAAPCVVEDGTTCALSFGTALWVAGTTGDTVHVPLPGDRSATVSRSDVRLSAKNEPPCYVPEDILGSARRFLGMRYLWGGTSGWGLDCSGLVHLAYRAHGVVVPRDAFDQADDVEPVPLDRVRPGDLYFFARPGERIYHVGFATRPVGDDGVRWMLHAPEGGELIEDAPMAPHRIATLVSAGRVTR